MIKGLEHSRTIEMTEIRCFRERRQQIKPKAVSINETSLCFSVCEEGKSPFLC